MNTFVPDHVKRKKHAVSATRLMTITDKIDHSGQQWRKSCRDSRVKGFPETGNTKNNQKIKGIYTPITPHLIIPLQCNLESFSDVPKHGSNQVHALLTKCQHPRSTSPINGNHGPPPTLNANTPAVTRPLMETMINLQSLMSQLLTAYSPVTPMQRQQQQGSCP